MSAKLTKVPAPHKPGYTLFGILNPSGQFWSHQTFFTPEEARKYIASFWKGRPSEDLEKFKVVPVRITIECAAGRAALEGKTDAGR